MFRASVAHHQGEHSCIKQSLNSTLNKLKLIGCSNYCAHINLYNSDSDKRTIVLHNRDDRKVGRLLYTTVHCPTMGQ